MRREDLKELHYITPIANLGSILEHGILSHNRAKGIPHESVAMQGIQDRRRNVVIPGGRPLHDYVNLYFCARNPMMYKRRSDHKSICVLQVSLSVLDIPETVITSQNASKDFTKFGSSPKGLQMIDKERVFAESWIHQSELETINHRGEKCAEVLVPDRVTPDYIVGVYVSGDQAAREIQRMGIHLPVTVNPHLFFQ